MRIRITLILVLCLSFLCLSAQERYDFAFRGVSIEQALSQIEDETGVSIVYNPREVAANKRISLTLSGLTAEETIRQVLGQDYRVLAKNGIYTIKKEAPKAPIVEEVKAEQIAQTEPVVEPEIEPEPDTPVAPVVQEVQKDAPIVPDTLVQEEKIEAPVEKQSEPVKPKKQQEIYQSTAHRLSIGVAPGVGGIYYPGIFTTTFDVQYAYFFHENWGIAAGAGINYFSKPKQQTDAQLLTLYMPVTFRMDYKLRDRLRLIGSAGASLELPISGVYGTDDLGERYSESILFGAIADIGVAVPLARTNHLFYALGISAYGQGLVTSHGKIKDELHHQGLYPWQVGLRIALLLNIRN